MPKKKKKYLKQIHLRFSEDELDAIAKDRVSIGGIPVSDTDYCKHAVLSYRKLRRLEEHVRKMAMGGYSEDCWKSAQEFLREAGL